MSGRRRRAGPTRPTLSKFSQEFVWRNKERVSLKDAPDNDHRVGAHYINHLVASKLTEMVGTNDGVFVATPNIVYARLELDDVVDMRSILNRPVHTTTNATQRIFAAGVAVGQLLEYRNHAIWIEAAIGEVDVGINAELELSVLLRNSRVNSYGTQALDMILTLIRIYDMNRLVATLKPILYEWEQDSVLLVRIVEESTDVTRLVELGSSERNGSRGLLHSSPTGNERRPNQIQLNNDAPVLHKCPTRYFGIDRYVCPIDS
jgi:hypothetical protein